MSNIKKNKKWIKRRHIFVRQVLYLILAPYAKLKYGVKTDRFREQGKRAYLVLYNHQTPFDQFFVGMSFKGPVYYLATEDIFSLGFISDALRYLVAPIPIVKQTNDLTAVKTCIRVAKEGGTIAIAPEGNRTYSGKTEYINPAIVKLARKIGLPIALYRIEGGYGVQPRWSDVTRKGSMHTYVSRVIEPEEYVDMTNDALLSAIEKELYINEGSESGIFISNHKAEYLERAIYVCPFCGLSHFESNGNTLVCKTCKRQVEYGDDKQISGIGFEFPFKYVNDWYEYQNDFVNGLYLSEYKYNPMYIDSADIYEVILYKNKNLLYKNSEIRLYGDRVEIFNNNQLILNLNFNSLRTVTVLGRNKLNIYTNEHIYQIKSSKRFNALKYVNIYYRYKNIERGNENGKFLGL